VTVVLLLTPDVVWGGWMIASGCRTLRRRRSTIEMPDHGETLADEIEAWLRGLPDEAPGQL